MGDKKFTFVELHLDGDTQFGPRSLPELVTGGTETEVEDESERETEEEEEVAVAGDDSGGNGAIGVVVALVVLVAIAVAVRKFRGGDAGDEREGLDEPDVIVE